MDDFITILRDFEKFRIHFYGIIDWPKGENEPTYCINNLLRNLSSKYHSSLNFIKILKELILEIPNVQQLLY